MVSSFLKNFLDHTQRRTTVGRNPLDEWSARRRDLYLTAHKKYAGQTSMPPTGFEPTISAGELPQAYALDEAATGTGLYINGGLLKDFLTKYLTWNTEFENFAMIFVFKKWNVILYFNISYRIILWFRAWKTYHIRLHVQYSIPEDERKMFETGRRHGDKKANQSRYRPGVAQRVPGS